MSDVPTLLDPATPGAASIPGAAPEPSSRREASWLRKGGAAPPRRRRRPLVRVLIALTSSTALFGVAALIAAAATLPPIGARRAARVSAQREVATQLAPGEKIIASAFASQRRWTDMWRESYGIVVATDNRVLYVGAPPTPILRPREDGPEELLVESYPYDAAFTLEPRSYLRGIWRGLELRTPGAHVNFLVDNATWREALLVSTASADARREVTQRDAAFDASNRAPLPPAEQYVTHVVRRGETLTGLAVRYRTSPEVLRQLNQLTTDAIRSGQRLRVPLVVPDSLSR